jgi:hypothetical protein
MGALTSRTKEGGFSLARAMISPPEVKIIIDTKKLNDAMQSAEEKVRLLKERESIHNRWEILDIRK